MKSWDITDKSGLRQAAADILGEALSVSGATVLALHGDLGAGKTTFVQTLAKSLGVTESVTSPTFVIMKKYQTTDARFASLVHIDAYRLESVDELTVLGFSSELSRGDTIMCIEWAEKVVALLPASTKHLRFTLGVDGQRTLTLE